MTMGGYFKTLWDQRVDATVHATNVGLYGDLLLAGTKYLRVRGGLRGDLSVYDVNDRLGTAAIQPGTYGDPSPFNQGRSPRLSISCTLSPRLEQPSVSERPAHEVSLFRCQQYGRPL